MAAAQASVLLAYRRMDIDARHRIRIAGIAMQRYNVDVTHSFSVLRRLSQQLNQSLSDIAGYVVDNRTLPPTWVPTWTGIVQYIGRSLVAMPPCSPADVRPGTSLYEEADVGRAGPGPVRPH